jgi:acyl-CoA thioesterase-1
VVLINPQYAPKVIAKQGIEAMVHLIGATAKENNVNLFQRFAVMRYWRLTEDIPFHVFTSADDVHMNDWRYGCIAKLLAKSIYEAATRPKLTTSLGARR